MTTWLVLYLWQAVAFQSGYAGGAAGGPVLIIQKMDSPEVCEEVGKVAKELGDATAPRAIHYWARHEDEYSPRPITFRCVVTRRRKP